MAVTFRSKNEVVTTVTGNATVTEPAGAANLDVLIAFALADADGANQIGVPAGWTNLYAPAINGVTRYAVSYIARGGSAPALTWTISGTSKYREVHVLCLTGAAAVTLDSQSSSGATGNATLTAHKPNPPATTAVASASLAVTGGYHYDGSVTSGWAVTGYTIRTRNTLGDDCFMGTKSLAASGSEDPAAATTGSSSVASDYWDGFTVTFTDTAGGASVTYPALERLTRGANRGMPGRVLAQIGRKIWTPSFIVPRHDAINDAGRILRAA